MKKPLQVFNLNISNKGQEVDINIDGQVVDASTQEIIKAWFGDTTSVSFKSFRDELAKTDASVYNVYINSPGGIVTDAMAIHDLLVDLQNKGKTVNTIGIGMVASSATLILLASKEPTMSSNCFFMIHSVSGGVYGTVDQIESYSKAMRKFNNLIVDKYHLKTGISKDEITSMMKEETYLTAQEAQDQKFIWKKLDDIAYTNTISPEDWPYCNSNICNIYNSAGSLQKTLHMKKFWNSVASSVIDKIKALKGKDDAEQTLISNIATEIGNAFNSMADEAENSFNSMVNDAIKNLKISDMVNTAVTNLKVADQVNTAVTNLKVADQVNTAVTAAMEPFNNQLSEIENKLAGDIGGGSAAPRNEQPKPVGSF